MPTRLALRPFPYHLFLTPYQILNRNPWLERLLKIRVVLSGRPLVLPVFEVNQGRIHKPLFPQHLRTQFTSRPLLSMGMYVSRR